RTRRLSARCPHQWEDELPPMDSTVGQEISYQRMLRALGGYLDHEPPGRFRVLEVNDGFTVLMERGTAKPSVQQVHFERSTLAEQAEQLVKGRKVFGRSASNTGAPSRTGHQDFLRAIGFELE